jgi:hypothetical protein
MTGKGFGKSQPTKTEKLIEQAVTACQDRRPEALDKIFDALPVTLNKQVLDGALDALKEDINSLAWLCGYFAGEINRSQDNEKLENPIVLLSKLLMKCGMQPFVDFMPYTGCRISILNSAKFESLPEKVQTLVHKAFDVREDSFEEVQRINDALLAEMMV